MGNSKGIVKRLEIGTIDAAKFEKMKLKQYKFKGKLTDYYVSNKGDVYSNKKGNMKKLKPTKTGNGYVKVRLSIDGKVYNRNIHRIVTETFIPNPDNKPEVNHINGNKKKNYVTNLEWCDRKANAIHAYNHGLFGIGENFSASEITDAQAIYICELLSSSRLSIKDIANKVGCSKKIVDDILHRRTWKYISKNYDFSNRIFHKTMDIESVIKICELLQTKKFSSKEIAEIVDCKVHIVKDIKRKKSWLDISKDYNF